MIVETKTLLKENREQVDLKYLIYYPDDYFSFKKRYPLVLFLHGAGERGDNIEVIKKHGIPKRIEEGMNFPFISVSPQCHEGVWWSHPRNLCSLEKLMKKMIIDLHINKNRIYGTGLSMGGYGILELASKCPNLFAAIVPICGGTITNQLKQLEKIPIWMFHGEKDDVIPIESSLFIYEYLKEKNKNIRLTTYPNIMHDSWTITYENQEVYDWLLSFKK